MMTTHRWAGLAGAVALLAATVPAADGEAAVILNPGFESPSTPAFWGAADNWSFNGTGGGIWNVNNTPAGFWTAPAPEGNQVVYVSPAPAPGGPASVFQTLTDTLQPATNYTLSGYVGHPIGYGATLGTTYTVELRAGGTLLDSITGTGPEGTFAPFQFTFDSTGSPYVGQSLSVHLLSSQAQTTFDAIALSESAVPEPATLSLAAIAGVALLSRRR